MTTLYWADGFDTYPSLTELAYVYSATPRLFGTTSGRFSGGAPGSDSNGGGAALQQSLPGNYVDAWYSMSFYWDSANGSRAHKMIHFFSAIGVEGNIELDSTNFNIKAYRGGNGTETLLGTSANNVFAQSAWTRLEARYKLDPSGGIIEVWVNGVQVLNITAANTRNNSTATGISLVYWPGRDSYSARWTGYFDDIAVSDARLGDLRIARVVPTSDAVPNNGTMTGGSGGNHYTCVSEARFNTSDYLTLTNTAGQEERFGVGALPTTPDVIWAVCPISVRQKSDAGAAAAYNVVRSGSSETLGNYAQLSTSWNIVRDIIPNDPATGAAWSASAVGSMKLGFRVSA